MNVAHLEKLTMKISRSPRELDQLRTTTRANMYLELKAIGERLCPGKFNKQECARIAMEAVNSLCGEPAAPGAPALPAGARDAVNKLLASLSQTGPSLMIAASFMCWSRAVGLLMRLKNDAARVDLEKAIELNPRNALAYSSLAYLSDFEGDAKKAIEFGKKSLELNPDLAESWTELGNAYEATGEHDLAKAAWERARSLGTEIFGAPKSGRQGPSDAAEDSDDPPRYEVIADEPES